LFWTGVAESSRNLLFSPSTTLEGFAGSEVRV
jgi:hypothetical protein